MTSLVPLSPPILEMGLLSSLFAAAFGCAAGLSALDRCVDTPRGGRLVERVPQPREWHEGRTMAGLAEQWDQHFASRRRMQPSAWPKEEFAPPNVRDLVFRSTATGPFHSFAIEGEML